jgi:hypothetical protein
MAPEESTTASLAQTAVKGSAMVLFMLASGQFLMTLDTSVMNVSIATVAQDIHTTVTGIQTAITFYTLVMAALMITGGKLGQIWGRKRAFAIGCVIYGCGSFITSISHNLTTLMIGWSFLEGVGAALILPSIVALVASNFAREQRPKAYGLIAAASAIAVATGPIIGGFCTTYLSWRYVFAGEVVVVLAILLLSRKVTDTPPESGAHLDLVGTVLSAAGLSLIVFGVLKSGSWGFVQAKPSAPTLLGLSPVIFFLLGGGLVLRLFAWWETRRLERGQSALLDPTMLKNRILRSGLTAFFMQFLLQMGLFFVVPIYLSVALGLSAIETGVRILPLSITLLIAAVGIPRIWPKASPRVVAQIGFATIFAGIVWLLFALDANASASVVTVPLLLAGLGVGSLASQLGAVTVSSVPDSQSSEVGGIQNTVTNLVASIGTALAGAILISALTSSFFTGIAGNPAIPQQVTSSAQVQLAGGVPFVSNEDLQKYLTKENVPTAEANAIITENTDARVAGLRSSLAVLALFALIALFFCRGLPTTQPDPSSDENKRAAVTT